VPPRRDFAAPRSDPARLGEEGYRLAVTGSRITIRAYRAAGVFYGVETLRQLLPPTSSARRR